MEDKVRVFEVAEEAGATSTTVIEKAAELSIVLKSPQSTVSFEQAEAIADYIMTGKSKLWTTDTTPIKKKKSEVVKDIKKETVDNTKEVKSKAKSPKVKVVTEKVEIKKRKELKIVQKKNPIIKKDKVEEVQESTMKKVEIKNKIQENKEIEKVSEEVKVTPKVEPAKPVVSTDKVTLKKRGLTIVKKNKSTSNNSTSTDEINKKQSMKSMSELFGKTPELKETYVPKQNKQKKTPAKSHEHGKILDVQSGESYGESNDSILGEEVMLHDMNLIETSKFLQET